MKWFRLVIGILCIALVIVYHVFPNIVSIVKILRLDAFTYSLIIVALVTFFWNQIVRLSHNVLKAEKRLILIFILIGLLVLHLFSSTKKIDINALWLISLAGIMFILPGLEIFIPYVKRLKVGDVEIELGDLKREVEKATEAVNQQADSSLTTSDQLTLKDSNQKVDSDIQTVLEIAGKSPKAALLLLYAKIEASIHNLFEQADIALPRTYSLNRLVELGVRDLGFPPEVLSAVREFSNVRNHVAHGVSLEIDDNVVLSVITTGTQLLKTISAIKPPKPISSS